MKRDFHIGPGAASLILIVVVMTMSVLSVLALTNARSDERLTTRAASVIEATGDLNVRAERSLANIDAVLVTAGKESEDDDSFLNKVSAMLPEGMEMNGRLISWSETDDNGRKLCCTVEISQFGSEDRYQWKEHRIGSEFAEMELEDTWN